MDLPLQSIRELVGDISRESFAHVDYAITKHVGLFIPMTGQCDLAITPEHSHPGYSFVVSFDDFCRLKIDNRIIRSKAGTFRAFSPLVPHQELPADAVPRYVAVMVDKEYFETQLRQYSAGDAPALRGDVFPSNERLLASLREFMSEYEDRALGYESLLTSAGLKIAHLIIRQILGIETKDEKVDFRMATNHAVEFMHTHLSEKLTLADLARTARLSPSQFSRVFKVETGTAPIEYLQELRLFRARRLLRDTIRPVTDIALECGFNSSSYLSRCFQSRWGLSPSKFRKTAHMRG